MRLALVLVLLVGCAEERLELPSQESMEALYKHTKKVWEAAERVYPKHEILNVRCDVLDDLVDCTINMESSLKKREVLFSREWDF